MSIDVVDGGAPVGRAVTFVAVTDESAPPDPVVVGILVGIDDVDGSVGEPPDDQPATDTTQLEQLLALAGAVDAPLSVVVPPDAIAELTGAGDAVGTPDGSSGDTAASTGHSSSTDSDRSALVERAAARVAGRRAGGVTGRPARPVGAHRRRQPVTRRRGAVRGRALRRRGHPQRRDPGGRRQPVGVGDGGSDQRPGGRDAPPARHPVARDGPTRFARRRHQRARTWRAGQPRRRHDARWHRPNGGRRAARPTDDHSRGSRRGGQRRRRPAARRAAGPT